MLSWNELLEDMMKLRETLDKIPGFYELYGMVVSEIQDLSEPKVKEIYLQFGDCWLSDNQRRDKDKAARIESLIKGETDIDEDEMDSDEDETEMDSDEDD